MENRFNINESEKTRIRGLHNIKVIKEESSGGYCDGPDGYKKTSSGWVMRENRIQGTQFYVKMRQRTDGKCDVLLKWEDGMTPINLGPYDRAYTLLGGFEELFLDLSANPQDFKFSRG